VERLLPFIEVLRLSSRQCTLSPNLFNAPTLLLRHLNLSSSIVPSVLASGTIFGGSASRLTTLGAGLTALRIALAYSSFEANMSALKKMLARSEGCGAFASVGHGNTRRRR